jgi:predicted transcriptional regulator
MMDSTGIRNGSSEENMGKRSKLEIYYGVLEAIKRGMHKPTQIMYETFLSWNTLNEALELLISNGFIKKEERNDSKRRYFITDKGQEALSYYIKSIEDLIQV